MSNKASLESLSLVFSDISGSAWLPLENQFKKSRFLILSENKPEVVAWIRQNQDRAKKVILDLGLDLNLTAKESTSAYQQTEKSLLSISDLVLNQLRFSEGSILPESQGLKLSPKDLSNLLSTTYIASSYGTEAVASGDIDSILSIKKQVEYIDNICRAFSCISLLSNKGALEPLKSKDQAVGVVVTTTALLISAGVIAIVSIAAIATIAWLILNSEKIVENNSIVKKACEKAIESGTGPSNELCIKLFKENSVATELPTSLDNIVNNATKLAVGAALLFLLVKTGPFIYKKYVERS